MKGLAMPAVCLRNPGAFRGCLKDSWLLSLVLRSASGHYSWDYDPGGSRRLRWIPVTLLFRWVTVRCVGLLDPRSVPFTAARPSSP